MMKQRVEEGPAKTDPKPKQPEDMMEVEPGKLSKNICFNCVEVGHFSTDCKAPRLCFICQTSSHVGRDCPKWGKPIELAQYLGSATQGLGLFHLDVQDEENKRGYMKFLDNCVVLTVEEGVIEGSEIIENLQRLFDKNWQLFLREIAESKYLVRFPPHKQIADTLISDTTYFKMRKEGVLVSLKSWTGDVEPYDCLDEVWVQISGVPPKWSKWRIFRQIASSLGKC
jgi:hypothetical protein